MTAQAVLAAARNHWGTENGQHWKLDVGLGEDASKVHHRAAAENLATVRRCVFNAHSLCDFFPKESMHRRAELAGLNNNYRTELVREEVFFTS